nr:RNA polymerase recycling motor ATPase HelR [Gordonia neofelifaecis]
MPNPVFDLPDRLADKTDPGLIAADAEHLARVADRVAGQITDLRAQLDAARRSTDVRVGAGLERDQEIRRLGARIRTLSRFGADVCLGRVVGADGSTTYVGRLGVSDEDGAPLLIDWRTPEAAPFFAATLAEPMGLVSRRHYRWSRERIVDFWDELFGPAADEPTAALDSQSAFIAGLGASRSPKMASVLGTIAADQDLAIRADSHGPLVVDGGPGTGKTVVALHRAAYLLYADPRLKGNRGGVLIVGPHRPYLSYISDVLPSLGEEGVATCTLTDLVPAGESALPESDPVVAQLKSSSALVGAVDAAVAFYEEPPTEGFEIDTPWGELWVSPADWAEAFAAVGPGAVHNEVREDVRDALLEILIAKAEPEVPGARLRTALEADSELARALRRSWPMIDPADLLSDLWAVPAYLRRCAPWLTADEMRALRCPEGSRPTVSDLPILDAARRRLGDPDVTRRRRRRTAELREQRRVRDDVVDELMAGDDRESLVSMLRAEDIQGVIVDESGVDDGPVDPLAGPFAHIVVDEAQDLTDAQWQMLLSRCPSRSFTIVGDRAQSRAGFRETWAERMERVGLGTPRRTTLRVNYRTPEEAMAEAGPAIRAALPDVEVPESIRASGHPVIRAGTAELDQVLSGWLASNAEGTACVIGTEVRRGDDRVRFLSPVEAKGLEFDLVVVVDPAQFGDGIGGAVDRYVAMTRTTSQLVLLAD